MLSKVVEYIMTGWPHHVDDDLKLFKMKELELTVEDGCVLWGRRVVIPAKHQHLVLNELHSGHQGIVKSKSLARLHVWWPNIDKNIENEKNDHEVIDYHARPQLKTIDLQNNEPSEVPHLVRFQSHKLWVIGKLWETHLCYLDVIH